MSKHSIRFLRNAEAEVTRLRAGSQHWPNTWSPTDVVEVALRTARDWTVGAQNNLVSIISGQDRQEDSLLTKERRWRNSTGKAFWLFFGWEQNNGERHIRKVEDRLSKLRKRLDNGITVKCRPGSGYRSRLCDDSAAGAFQQLGWFAADNINLCPQWFRKSPETRAAIIVHELMHGIGGAGTRDQRNADGEVVYGARKAIELADDIPERARKNATNYQQFMQYRAWYFDLPRIGTRLWNGLPRDLDAALMHKNGLAYFFKGDTYYRWRGTTGIDAIRRIGRDGWKGVPDHIEAVVPHPNGNTYFFKYGYYFRYVSGVGVDKRGKTGVDGWSGLSGPVDAAFVHPYTGDAWFFQGVFARRFDFAADRVVETKLIKQVFARFYGHIDACLYYPPYNSAYAFVGDRYMWLERARLAP